MNQQAFKRICKAILLLVLCAGILCIGTDLFTPNNSSANSNAEVRSEAFPGSYLDAMQMVAEEDINAALTAQTLFGISVENSLPDTFACEALGEEGFEESYLADGVVGLVYAGSPEDAAQYCAEALKTKGWYQIEQTDEHTSSFAKSEGTYHWLVLQFLSIEEKTMVIANTISSL